MRLSFDDSDCIELARGRQQAGHGECVPSALTLMATESISSERPPVSAPSFKVIVLIAPTPSPLTRRRKMIGNRRSKSPHGSRSGGTGQGSVNDRGYLVPHPPNEIGFCRNNSWMQAAADYINGIVRSGVMSLIKNDAKGCVSMTENSGFPSLANPSEPPCNGRMLAARRGLVKIRNSGRDSNSCQLPSGACRLRMDLFVALLLAVACAGSTAGHAETATPNPPIDDLPKRKPGLWRISTISPEIGMQTHEVCIEESDGIVGASEESCAKPLVERASDQTIVTIACDRKDGRKVTSILFTGDFQDWYRAQSKTSSTDAIDGSIRRSGFTIEARRLRDGFSQPCTH